MEGIEMRISLLSITLLLAVAAPECAQTEPAAPLMTAVEPVSGKIGDVLIVQGVNLGLDNVAALYLTDGKTDTKVVIAEQTVTSIKFQIPPEAKAGRFALMVLTKGKGSKFIEEPVKITVESEGTRPET
jgi:hypothetical protein